MTERKKLSLGNVTERENAPADPTKAWKLSPARVEALKQRARDQRRNPSEAQRLLWERLDDKKCGGFAFNREVVMGSSIVDFTCKPRWLVVETGANSEAEVTRAELSDRKLRDVGVRVLRFSDEQVLGDTDGVVAAILAELQKPFERPRTSRGGANRPAPPNREERFHRSRF